MKGCYVFLIFILSTSCKVYDEIGCTDINAVNFCPACETDNSTCIYSGCKDSLAYNYCPECEKDNKNCVYEGCTHDIADNFCDSCEIDNGNCIYSGCLDENADNYCAFCQVDSSSKCIYSGCMDTTALNYCSSCNQHYFPLCNYNFTWNFYLDSFAYFTYIDGNNIDSLVIYFKGIDIIIPADIYYNIEPTCNEINNEMIVSTDWYQDCELKNNPYKSACAPVQVFNAANNEILWDIGLPGFKEKKCTVINLGEYY